MGSKSSRTYLAFIKEESFGVLPDNPTMQKVNYTKESFDHDIKKEPSESVRDDRQLADLIPLSGGNQGGYEFEFQPLASGETDPLLVSSLWSSGWSSATTPELDLQGATIDATKKIIDFTPSSAGVQSLAIGQKFMIAGTAGNTNDGIYTILTDNQNGSYTIVETFPATGTLGATAKGYKSAYIRNGLTRSSFAWERGHSDVSEFFLLLGMVINDFNLQYEAGGKITGGFSFIGKSISTAQATNSSSLTAQPQTAFLSAGVNINNVRLNNAVLPSCVLMGVELTVSNNAEGKLGVGSFDFCNVSEGRFSVTGKVTLYFNDTSFYNSFLDNTGVSISWTITDNAGVTYVFTLPRMKILSDPVNSEGGDSDIMDNAEFVATRDPITNCMIQIDRFVVA